MLCGDSRIQNFRPFLRIYLRYISIISIISSAGAMCQRAFKPSDTSFKTTTLGAPPWTRYTPPIAVFVNFGLIWLDAPIAKKPPIGKHLLSTSSKLFYADDRLRWMCGCGIGDFWHRPAEHIVWRSLIYSMLISRNIGHQRLSESRSAWPLDGSPMATYIQ